MASADVVLWQCRCGCVNLDHREVCRRCGDDRDVQEIEAARARIAEYRAWCRNPIGKAPMPKRSDWKLIEKHGETDA